MTAVESQVEAYFASMNSVAKKITQDCITFKDSYGSRWGELTLEQQERLLDDFVIDPQVAEKYDQGDEDIPDVFPKYRINCGEKIVVDFDHDDGWTWQDEHSGPFSWRTKSQQDLTMEEIDDLVNEPKEETKRQKMMRKSRSPEPIDPSACQANTNEVEQIFQKFGITFHNKDEESNDEAENSDKNSSQENLEDFSLSVPSTELSVQHAVFDEQENEHHAPSSSSVSFSREGSMSQSEFSFDGYHGREMLDRTQSSSERSSSTISTNSSRSKKKGSNKIKDKLKVGKGRPEAEQSLLSDLSIILDKSRNTEEIGQVSPVFIEDPGETSTDIIGTTYTFPSPKHEEPSQAPYELDTAFAPSTDYTCTTTTEGVVDAWNAGDMGQVEDENEDVPKTTGFEFLDNW